MCLASSKQRSNLHRAIATDKAKIQAAIKKYLLVQQLLPSHDRLQLAEEAIMNGAFPWSALAGAQLHVPCSPKFLQPQVFIKGFKLENHNKFYLNFTIK